MDTNTLWPGDRILLCGFPTPFLCCPFTLLWSSFNEIFIDVGQSGPVFVWKATWTAMIRFSFHDEFNQILVKTILIFDLIRKQLPISDQKSKVQSSVSKQFDSHHQAMQETPLREIITSFVWIHQHVLRTQTYFLPSLSLLIKPKNMKTVSLMKRTFAPKQTILAFQVCLWTQPRPWFWTRINAFPLNLFQ